MFIVAFRLTSMGETIFPALKCCVFVHQLLNVSYLFSFNLVFAPSLSNAFIANIVKRKRVTAIEERGDNAKIALLPDFLEQALRRIFESQGEDATFLDSLTFEGGAIDYTETSIQIYHCTLRQIPEERRSRNHELYQLSMFADIVRVISLRSMGWVWVDEVSPLISSCLFLSTSLLIEIIAMYPHL